MLSGLKREEQLLTKGKLYKKKREIMISHARDNSIDKKECTFRPKTNAHKSSRSLTGTMQWDIKHLELDLLTNDFNDKVQRSLQNTMALQTTAS